LSTSLPSWSDRYHLALLAMTVHSDINHAQGLLPVGCMIGGRERSRPLTMGAEARSFIASIARRPSERWDSRLIVQLRISLDTKLLAGNVIPAIDT
jgi:hypothetical protein